MARRRQAGTGERYTEALRYARSEEPEPKISAAVRCSSKCLGGSGAVRAGRDAALLAELEELGREWFQIEIADDFHPPKDGDETDGHGNPLPGRIDDVDARLAYVPSPARVPTSTSAAWNGFTTIPTEILWRHTPGQPAIWPRCCRLKSQPDLVRWL
ncbi:hypothetical protein [Actinacidiphila glaucinigra]|uniref:hypothetical protein n=1 Tax=Actinacidiphila glaucinigra TaxID=235986 RepID=UPI00117F9909